MRTAAHDHAAPRQATAGTRPAAVPIGAARTVAARTTRLWGSDLSSRP